MTVHEHGRYSTRVDDLPYRSVPEAAVGRLAVYLRVLTSMIEQGVTTMSSEVLAGAAGVNSATLRKDLSYVGSYGTRGWVTTPRGWWSTSSGSSGLPGTTVSPWSASATLVMHWPTTRASRTAASQSQPCSTSTRT